MGFVTIILLTRTNDTQSSSYNYQISITDVVASGLNHPVQVTHANDGSGRLFIVEQSGKIRIIQNGNLKEAPFLDIGELVVYGGERGLLGLAFHPDYVLNQTFYLNYTRKPDGATVVARYQVSNNPDIADPSSAQILLTISQPYSNHNGGQLLFGHDGYLYIGMGDGGSGGDPQNYALNINSLLGKMLRIDVDSGFPYSIPPSNPYVGKIGEDEIWALGLRNPWRFSFDRLTGDLYIGDVGQGLWEEIDYLAFGSEGGANFGWRCKEGTHLYNSQPPCNNSNYLSSLLDPITEYSHSEGFSVTGGFVYRGLLYPNLYGNYYFADYVTGKIWSIIKTGTNPDTWSPRTLELNAGINISAFGEDENGEIYICDYGGGTIRQLRDISGTPDLTGSEKSSSSLWADPGEIITYTISLINQGGSILIPGTLTDTIPTGLIYLDGSLIASDGSVDDSQSPNLNWAGTLLQGVTVTIQYQAIVTPTVPGSLTNHAYFVASNSRLALLSSTVFSPRPILNTTMDDYLLPGTQPHGISSPLINSVDCDTCHNAPIYDRWRGSAMSQAGRDPLLWAALAASNHFAPESGELCLRCHTPMGWFAGNSIRSDGTQLTPQEISNGVSCHICHRMVDPYSSTGSIDDVYVIDQQIRQELTFPPPTDMVGSGMMIIDPLDRRRGPFSLGITFSYHSAYRSDFLGQTGDAITESRLCGTCHNVFNPLLSWDEQKDQYWPNPVDQPVTEISSNILFPIETTYEEWLLSDYANGGVEANQFAGYNSSQLIQTCQDCHMTRLKGIAADENFFPIQRDCLNTGCLPEHNLSGANSWLPELLLSEQWRLNASSDLKYLESNIEQTQRFLTKAASLDITMVQNGNQKSAIVKVTNETGHKLPTGYPEGRRIWINLKAFDDSGNILTEYGSYDPVTAILSEDTTIFEVKQGLTPELAEYLDLTPGPSFHFMLNNTVIKDNRIPPRGYTQVAFDRPGLKPIGETYLDDQYWHETQYTIPENTAVVHATLYYQVASKEYIEFLGQYGGQDGMSLLQLYNQNPSSPQVIQVAYYPNYKICLPWIAH